jgi:hypothetical protein
LIGPWSLTGLESYNIFADPTMNTYYTRSQNTIHALLRSSGLVGATQVYICSEYLYQKLVGLDDSAKDFWGFPTS